MRSVVTFRKIMNVAAFCIATFSLSYASPRSDREDLAVNSAVRDRVSLARQSEAGAAQDLSDLRFANFVYEIVSFKPLKNRRSGDSGGYMGSQETPDGFTSVNTGLIGMLGQAYRSEHMDISGAPPWLTNEIYDVEAKMAPEVMTALQALAPEDRVMARKHMMQVLLREYLKLKIHTEQKQVPVYDLIVSKNGPKFKESEVSAVAGGMSVSASGGTALITGRAAPLSRLIGTISYALRRPVFDKTGLNGRYDFTLLYAPQRYAPSTQSAGDVLPPADSGEDLATAIEEQLGLKLVSAKGLIDVIVIDHIERPNPN